MKAERTRDTCPVLFCVRAPKPADAPGQPAEQAQAHEAERHREIDAAARRQNVAPAERADAAGRLEHHRHGVRVGLC